MSEYHVCGLLLMSRPEHGPTVLQALGEMSVMELHANIRLPEQ